MYTFQQYHADVSRHTDYPEQGNNLVYPALGAAGEAGEVAEKVKKIWRNYGQMGVSTVCASTPHAPQIADKCRELIKEIGDVLWYLDAMASELNVSLEHIAQENARKLDDRARRGVLKSEGDNR